jgi:hypothetical protein
MPALHRRETTPPTLERTIPFSRLQREAKHSARFSGPTNHPYDITTRNCLRRTKDRLHHHTQSTVEAANFAMYGYLVYVLRITQVVLPGAWVQD